MDRRRADVRCRHARLRGSRRRHRTVRVPSAAGGAAHCAADQRPRGVDLPPEQRASGLRRRLQGLRHVQPDRREDVPRRERLLRRAPNPDRRLSDGADGGADVVRRAHAAGEGHAGDIVRPRGSIDAGHRRRSRDRGTEGIHGRGDRRYRQHPRGDARRTRRRAGGVLQHGVPTAGFDVPESVRLRATHRRHSHPAERAAWCGGAQEGLMTLDGPDIPKIPARPDEADRPRVGIDDWVAEAEARREQYAGVSGAVKRAWQWLPPAGRLGAFVVPAAFFPLVTSEGNLFRYGIFTLLYALLGLGLNFVVGFAGLLDLGYVAFFGFGAYLYGILASNQFHNPLSAEAAIPLVVVATAFVGLLVGLPSRRLLGDYLAIVTLFFLQAFVVFVNNAQRIRFPFFGYVNLTGGPNGLDNIDP